MKLKAYIQYWIALCSIIFVASCSDDLDLPVETNVREGIPVEIKVKFGTSVQQTVETRAEGDDVVYDYYIFVFDSNKILKTKEYHNAADDRFTFEKQITIHTTSGVSYIMAVANIHGEGLPSEYGNSNVTRSTQAALTNATVGTFSMDDLKSLRIGLVDALNPDVINRQKSSFAMSGKYVPTSGEDRGDGYCVIPEQSATLTGEIQLYRTDACITFNLRTGDKVLTVNGGNTPTFTPTSFRVVNIPRYSRMMNETEDWDGTSGGDNVSENDYYEIPETTPITISTNVTENNKTYQTFTFYLPENRKSAKSATQTDGSPLEYTDRERQEKQENADGTMDNGAWSYAPERGTYVIINGTFSGYAYENGENGNVVPIDAEVTYKIHLGDFSEANGYDYSNFHTKRNTEYIYNVSVNGVDNIIVEVETNQENQPGATGDIYFTNETNLYTLDAHYETCLMRFTKAMVTESPSRLTYRVRTPFTEYLADTDENRAADANWVRFAVNKIDNGGIYSDDLQSYSEGNASEGIYNNGSYNEKELLTVDELIEILKYLADHENDSRWRNDVFVVTCFVNEYYYTHDANESGYQDDYDNGAQYVIPATATNVDRSVPAWKYAVNQPNRTLQLLCDVRSSADGESSIVDAAYVISQRSIQTFYNTDVSLTGLTSALGVETISETGSEITSMGYSANNSSDYPQDFRRGLTNTKAMWANNNGGNMSWGSSQWDNYIDAADNGYTTPPAIVPTETETAYIGLQNNYRNVYIACLQRNRDVNRDGKIDEDEIKWYLPALNQYAALYMGENALTQESRFYTHSDWRLKHFYSSTYNDVDSKTITTEKDDVIPNPEYNQIESDEVMTFWSEEGFSTSTYGQTIAWKTTSSETPIYRYYRCVRNLGNTTIDNENEVPQNYWERNGSVISFTYLDNDAVKGVALGSGELSNTHTNRSTQNRVYSKFEYATADATGHINAAQAHAVSTNICQNYQQDGHSWRMPNLRELLFLALNSYVKGGILSDFPTTTDHNYHSRTLFYWYANDSRNGSNYLSPLNNQYRYGYKYEGGNISLEESGSYNSWGGAWNFNVRCVRDVTE